MHKPYSCARVLVGACAALALLAPGAGAAEPPPGAVISDSLDYVGKLPGTTSVIEGKFDKVDGRDILVVDGSWGLKTFDVSDPAHPVALGEFLPPGLQPGGFWEGEDLDIDPSRRLAFMSMDPRHVDVDQVSCPGTGHNSSKTRNPNCRSGIVVVSYADTANLRQVGDFVDVPAGHTTSCIEHCRFLWTNGPARRDDQIAQFGPYVPGGFGDGRPAWVTDMRNPAKPHVFPDPIDINRNNGQTDYTHDIQVDADGIAWSSGRGGIRGYATRGVYRDPVTDERRPATPWDPILVAGGGVGGVSTPGPNGMFMHNSMHPLGGKVHAEGVADGNILVGTEEQFNSGCATDGRLVFSDLTDSLGGEPAQNSTPADPYLMKAISTWHPLLNTSEGNRTDTSDCSAHYFDIEGATLTQAWYSQGTRVLDISDAANPRQIAYFRVQSDGAPDNPSSVVWDTTFHGGKLWVFDNRRGVEVLTPRFSTDAPQEMGSVVAPAAGADPFAAVPVGDRSAGLVCPLFVDSPATREAKAAAGAS
jgi:hypothetical protein